MVWLSRGDIIVKAQDLSYLSWDECKSPSGLAGACAKAREGRGANAIYYKRSHEGSLGDDHRGLLAELVGMRLAGLLGFPHVPFQLVRARLSDGASPVWVAKSKSYRQGTERALSLVDYMELCGDPHEDPYGFFCRMGWRTQAASILLYDYLTATRDRDASDFEVLLGANGAVRLSPISARPLSLVNAFPLGLWRRDPLADVSSASFLNHGSQAECLAFVAETLGPLARPRGLKRALLGNLGDVAADRAFLEGCCEIIDARWDAYARVCRL